MTLEEKIEEIVKHKLISINNANVVSVNDGFKQELLALIKEEAVKARLDELKQLWNSTQPDLVPQGVKPNDMSDKLHQRVNQLQAELEQSNNKDA